jgi:hypothetical protein
LYLLGQVWQILAIPTICIIGLYMRDHTLCRIDCHAAVVVELSGLSGLNRDTGFRIMWGIVCFVANQLCLLT